jgi:uncharacterized protein YgiM (DUF1202 family)
MKTQTILAGIVFFGLTLIGAEASAHHRHDSGGYDNGRRSTAATQVVTADSLHVRRGPGRGFRAIAVLRHGEHVQVLANLRGWSKVRTRHVVGWASSRFLSSKTRGQSHRSRPRFASIEGNRFGFAFMFERANRRAFIVGRLFPGERVRVLDRGHKWTLVAKRGIGRGYVRTRLLNL